MTGPHRFELGPYVIHDVRHMFLAQPPGALATPLDEVDTIEVHHDGVLFERGDKNHNGRTLDEDIARLRSHHAHAMAQGWGSYPYHFAATPHGRLFYTLDMRYRGSHAKARNSKGRAIVLLSDFTAETPRNAQLSVAGLGLALMRIIINKRAPVNAHTELPSPAGDTECPGATWPRWKARLLSFRTSHHTALLDMAHTTRATLTEEIPQGVSRG
jgi:hypothetical protein